MNQSHRRTEDERRQIVSAQPASGLSVAAYCRREGISQPSFFLWRRRFDSLDRLGAGKLTAGRLAAAARGGPFVEVKTPDLPRRVSAVEVRLRRGRRLVVRSGFDRDLLGDLVMALEAIP
jgi:transposase-like protein